MKKASYRLLQWTMLMGTGAMMATACVVTSGDGDDDSFFDGGEGGTSSTAGKTSTEAGEGGTSTAGTTSGGSASGGTAGTTSGGTAGAGGSGSSYVPGVCQGGDEPSVEPSCAPTANDEGEPCTVCLKSKCCAEWQTCYGSKPTSACGWGVTEAADGQFDCIYNCYQAGLPNAVDLTQLQSDCADECLNQCEDGAEDMGFVTDITQDVLICANENCLDECFPAE
jgi:hypothetical protein